MQLARSTHLADGLVTISHHWNNFLWPLVVTNSVKTRPLTGKLGIFGAPESGVDGSDTGELGKLFRYEVFKVLKAEGKINDVIIENMMNWPQTRRAYASESATADLTSIAGMRFGFTIKRVGKSGTRTLSAVGGLSEPPFPKRAWHMLRHRIHPMGLQKLFICQRMLRQPKHLMPPYQVRGRLWIGSPNW